MNFVFLIERLLFNYGNISGQEGLTVNTSKSASLF